MPARPPASHASIPADDSSISKEAHTRATKTITTNLFTLLCILAQQQLEESKCKLAGSQPAEQRANPFGLGNGPQAVPRP